MADNDTKAIVTLSNSCLQAWAALEHEIAGEDTSVVDTQWAEDQHLMFSLWTARLGVFAADRLSINHRLRRNDVAAKVIAQTLTALLSNLHSSTAISAPELKA